MYPAEQSHRSTQLKDNAPKQAEFGVTDVGFSRNSLFALVDASYQSKNQKGVLKAGASSGVQIVTQSDIGNLNRDLSNARELVKDHKHYVRVLVPIPTKDGFESIWDDVKELVTSRQNNAENTVQDCDWDNPDNVWHNPDYEAICEQLDQNDDLTAKQKVKALKEYTDLERQKRDIDAMIKNHKAHQNAENEHAASNDRLEPYDVRPMDKPDFTAHQNEWKSENIIDNSNQYDDEYRNDKENKNKPILTIGINEEDITFNISTLGAAKEEAYAKYFKPLPVFEQQASNNIISDDRELGLGHDIAVKIRQFEKGCDAFKEKHPYLHGAASFGGLFVGGIAKNIGQKVIQMGVGFVGGMAQDEILQHLHESTNPKLEAFEQKWGITRKDTLTYASLVIAGSIYKATPGGSSKSALKPKKTRVANDNVGVGPRVKKVNKRQPINAEYAGKVYPLDKLPEDLRRKYPHSVPFTGTGHPDFSRYAQKKVKIKMTGDRGKDESRANKIAGLKKRPEGYTWHHHHDGETMMLVPEDLHLKIKHTGGAAIVKGKKQ